MSLDDTSPASVPARRLEPRWDLPDAPSLEWLRRRAKKLRRRFTDGDPEALALVADYDPPAGDDISLARAQRVLARAFGFANWSSLRAHLGVIETWSRSPSVEASGPESPADTFLRLAFLTYTTYDAADQARARRMLVADPSLATDSVWTMAACGRAADLARLLEVSPELADAQGGPMDWTPLLYLCYSRLSSDGPAGDLLGDPVEAARVLLRFGADPDAGFLWHGLTSPFTAVTGAFGGGERGEPFHPRAVELARVLLDAGADPNDNQTLYNRMFTPDDSHLELLFEFGLGEDRPSVWRDRLGTSYPSPAEMVGEQLRNAAEHGLLDRVRLLLAQEVDPETRGYHPILGDQTAYEVAVRHGQAAAAALIARAGAGRGTLDDVDDLVFAALNGDAERVRELQAADPALAARAVRRRRDAMPLAAGEHGRVDALDLLLSLGFPVDRPHKGSTALHEAALAGRTEAARWLLAHGADPARRDRRFDSTPAGWAAHAGHDDLAAELLAAMPDREAGRS